MRKWVWKSSLGENDLKDEQNERERTNILPSEEILLEIPGSKTVLQGREMESDLVSCQESMLSSLK